MQSVLSGLRRATVKTVVGTVVVVGTLEVTTHLPSEGRSSQLYHDIADKIIVPSMRTILSPEQAHQLAIQLARFAPTFRPSPNEQKVNVAVRLWQQDDDQEEDQDQAEQKEEDSNGLLFTNPIGLAAGYDKDATAIIPLLNMGFGFVEIGSVCLKPQPGNPSPRMFRLVDDHAIINRYGFNSAGGDAVQSHLQEFRNTQELSSSSPVDEDSAPWFERLYDFVWPGRIQTIQNGILGVNLGKNKTSTTPIEDYQSLIGQLGPYADYLVINVSSPNTPGLRDLQESSSLEALLKGCQDACQKLPTKKPLLVKLAPDLSDDELKDLASLFVRLKIDGIILTNTTTARPASLITPGQVKQETGGLSGRPLKTRSTQVIRLLYECTNGTIPIIGVGGVESGTDAYAKFKAGASLVQVYSSLVYGGPGLVSRIRDDVARLMIENGQRDLQNDVVGLDHEQIFWKKQRKAADLKMKKLDEESQTTVEN
mmetsp:Transcript_23176/g.54968  ORF Transcript_23176/g.54968 Transcript_23176/m.54968 type:complete len:481 (+) Transcript_23176:92-1534(+)